MSDITSTNKEFAEVANYQYCSQALEFERQLSGQFLTLAEYLYNIRENNLFAPQWDSFNEYCTEFKSLSQASISRLIGIYQKFIVEYQVPRERIAALGGWSNIASTLAVVNSKQDAEEWLHKAETLHRDDLRRELTEHKTGRDMRDCAHENFYSVKVCRDCHDRIKIDDSNNEL